VSAGWQLRHWGKFIECWHAFHWLLAEVVWLCLLVLLLYRFCFKALQGLLCKGRCCYWCW
jgi:hypothetical protein